MVHIQIDETFTERIQPDDLRIAAQTTLTHQSAPANAEMTLVITNDQRIQALNRRFRDVDSPTDVLSFPSGEHHPDSDTYYLGDVLISLPYAQAQANQGGHTLAEELQLLTVHGTLHLFSHDHADPIEKERMWTAQDEILDQLGCSIRSPS